MPAYSMHVRTHNQGCKCPYCGKCFSRPWLLQGHIRTHTGKPKFQVFSELAFSAVAFQLLQFLILIFIGEKPFRCNVCNKAFADKSNLRAHVQTHSNTKPFICGRCGKAFALKSYLYKHEESSCMKLNRGQEGSSSSSGSSPPSPHSVEAVDVCGDVSRPFVHPGHIIHINSPNRNVGIMA